MIFVKAIRTFEGDLRGQDVFAVLPTGFGKSFCFSGPVLPYVHDQLFVKPGHRASIVLCRLTQH